MGIITVVRRNFLCPIRFRVPESHALTRCGFTLIELLIVATIIIILASTLFPVFTRARDDARRITCQSNLRQISLALMVYTQDYDEKYPAQDGDGSSPLSNPDGFPGKLYPYTRSYRIFHCPSVTSSERQSNYPGNGAFFRPTGVSEAAVAGSPLGDSGLIVLQEYIYSKNRAVLRPFPPTDAQPGKYWHSLDGGKEAYGSTHFNGANYLFADGHVKWRKTTTLHSAEFGFVPDTPYRRVRGADCNGPCKATF